MNTHIRVRFAAANAHDASTIHRFSPRYTAIIFRASPMTSRRLDLLKIAQLLCGAPEGWVLTENAPRRISPHDSISKAPANERRYPNIVEFAVPDGGLKIELSRRITEFHRARQFQARHGRSITKDNQTYGRWCFEDLGTACDFIEQFGGTLAETGF
jgi:hypothetical protein